MYQERLRTHGATQRDVSSIHSTRFQCAILEQIPELCESKQCVNFDGDISQKHQNESVSSSPLKHLLELVQILCQIEPKESLLILGS